MTPAELLAWRNRLYPSQQAAADALGMTKKPYQELERGQGFGRTARREIDQRTALACAMLEVLEFGLDEALQHWPELSARRKNGNE